MGVWLASDRPDAEGELDVDGRAVPGRLLFDCSYNLESFEIVRHKPPYVLFRYLTSPTKYYCVDAGRLAHTDEEALALVSADEFDPARAVILSAPLPAPLVESADPRPAIPAEVLEDDHARVRLRVVRASPGYLVRSHYPGWKARVNGVEQPVLRANYALSAVQVGAGTSEVELYYDPLSVRAGLWVSGASLLAWLAWAGAAFIGRRTPGLPGTPRQ
jgi:hypothetical protein